MFKLFPGFLLGIMASTVFAQVHGGLMHGNGGLQWIGLVDHGGAPSSLLCDEENEEHRIAAGNGVLYVCDRSGVVTGWSIVLDFSL